MNYKVRSRQERKLYDDFKVQEWRCVYVFMKNKKGG